MHSYTVNVTLYPRTGSALSLDSDDAEVTCKARNRSAAELRARAILEKLQRARGLPTNFGLRFNSVARKGDTRPWLTLQGGSSPFGASMGRSNVLPDDVNAPTRFHVRRVPLDSGGYDSAGSYWGHGDPLYYAVSAQPCRADGARARLFVRAEDHGRARFAITCTVPGATFYR